MATNRIKTRPPFKNLFPVDEKIFNAVAEDMKVRGYDQSQPIIVWKEKLDASKNDALVIDGHTRLFAAKRIGLSPVYIARVSFPDEQEALQYAIHNQRDRRNMTDADILSCIEAVDHRRQRGGDHTTEEGKAKSASQPIASSAQETAKIVGTSEDKVKKARTVLDHADEKTKEEVFEGKKSIHKAAKETQEKQKKQSESDLWENQAREINAWRSVSERIKRSIALIKKNCRCAPPRELEIIANITQLVQVINSLQSAKIIDIEPVVLDKKEQLRIT